MPASINKNDGRDPPFTGFVTMGMRNTLIVPASISEHNDTRANINQSLGWKPTNPSRHTHNALHSQNSVTAIVPVLRSVLAGGFSCAAYRSMSDCGSAGFRGSGMRADASASPSEITALRPDMQMEDVQMENMKQVKISAPTVVFNILETW